MTTITRARAAAILALGAIALTACHPDDNLTPAEGKIVTISATAALPTAGMQASGATSRAASTSTQQSVNFDFDNNSTIPVTLNTYSGSSKKGYAYNFNKTTNANATGTAKLEPKSDDDALKAKSGSSLELDIDEMKLPLLLPIVRTLGGGSTATALVPFSARAKMKKQSFTVGTDGTLTKELTLAYTTTALRLRLVIADGVSPVAQVSCPLAMADGAEKESILIRTDGTDVPATTEQTAIFGELTPGTTLKAGDIAALLRLSDGSNPDGGTGTLLAVPWTPAVLAKINSQIPKAGHMITLTVHVSRTVATIATDDISIGGFTDGNGDGEDITAGYQGDGTNTLDTKIFNANNPLWVISGGGNGNNDNVVANVRAALESMKNTDGSLPTGAQGVIDLMLTGVTGLPSTYISSGTFEYNRGAFQDCPQLRSVNAPKATTIGENAFKGCTALKSVSLPAATEISWDMFDGCAVLTSIDISGVMEAQNIIGFVPDSRSAEVRPEVSLGEILFGKKDGATTRGNVGDDTFDTTKCNLVISRTLYDNSDVTDIANKMFCRKTWASITYPGAPRQPQQ